MDSHCLDRSGAVLASTTFDMDHIGKPSRGRDTRWTTSSSGSDPGASLVVIGWLFREWGPRIRDRRPADDEILSAEEMVTRMAWARFCGTCGMALLLCGVLILLITAVVAAIGPSDDKVPRPC